MDANRKVLVCFFLSLPCCVIEIVHECRLSDAVYWCIRGSQEDAVRLFAQSTSTRLELLETGHRYVLNHSDYDTERWLQICAWELGEIQGM